MILYNRTKLDDEILRNLLYAAAKFTGIGVRTRRVVVRVTTASYHLSGNVKTNYMKYWERWLRGEKKYGIGANDKLVNTDGGYLFLKIPVYRRWPSDALEFAEDIFKFAAHEWKHIADLQKKKHFGNYNKRWKNRPHEKRAVVAASKAVRAKDKRQDIQNAVINLGINIECLREQKSYKGGKTMTNNKKPAVKTVLTPAQKLEKKRAGYKKYYAANKEKYKAWNKKWREAKKKEKAAAPKVKK